MAPCTAHERNAQEPLGFTARNMLWRTPVEYVCWPASYSKADTLNSAAFNAERGTTTIK